MRKTKIICTIGPDTSSYEMLRKLHEAGMDVVRLNMSHGDHDSCGRIIKSIRTLNQHTNRTIPILLDTQGPEIRTAELSEALNLETGSTISLVVRGAANVEESSIQVDYADFMEQVHVGDTVTVDSGMINLEVLTKQDRAMTCRVIHGGFLQSKRHVNLPGIRVNLPAITSKDREDILFGLEQAVDYIALSFTRAGSDIDELHELLGEQAKKVRVIAKIEDQEGVRNMKELVDKADGIMVARGDLGVEVDFVDVPNIQRSIVKLCAERGKRVIVATHLLESMIENPVPTRAEVTDVANATYEEVDAVMLSGETAAGKHPVRCVEYMSRICLAAEKRPGLRFSDNLETEEQKQSIASSAVHLAESIHAAGIVVITRSGRMADYVTNCRPFKSPIYAVSNDSRTRRRLALNHNVQAVRSNFSSTSEKTLLQAFKKLFDNHSVQPKERMVVISDVLVGTGIEAIQIREIPDFNSDSESV